MPDLARRTVLLGAGALALLPAVMPPASGAAVEAAPLVVTPPARQPWWGWSDCLERWSGPFDSREAAIEDARQYCEEGFTTGLCHPRVLSHPNYAEAIVEWLGDVDRSGVSLAAALRDAFEGRNMEDDFEGEVSEDIGLADWEALAARVLPLIEAAFERAGFFVSAPPAAGMFGDVAILEVLTDDVVFATALVAVADEWSDGNQLLHASLMVDLTDEREEPAAAPE